MCSFLFFALFGFAEEARKNYRAAITYTMMRVGITSTGSMRVTLRRLGIGEFTTSAGSFGTLPVFAQRETVDSSTKNTLASSSDKELEKKPSDKSFGAPFPLDVGGTLAVPAFPSLPAPTFGWAPFIASQKDDSGDLDIEISSSRYSITPPEAVHVRKVSSNIM
ncbi:a-factor receptor [Marasmius tenuissimus]|nr:a-factor receptor [Marasmius tenuissimus]